MTQPTDVAISTPGTAAADAAAAALVENKDRLGLTWDLRPATVLSSDLSTGKVTIMADGDSTGLAASSMIGKVFPGDRVYLILLPTGGIFIAGYVGPGNTSGDTIGAAYWTGGTTAGSTGAEAALGGWSSSSPFHLLGNRVARLTLTAGYLTNSAAVSAQVILVRQVVGSTSATGLLTAQVAIAAGLSGTVLSLVAVSYIKNTGEVPVTFNPGVSNIRTVGAGTNSIFGDANVTLSLVGNDIGSINDFNMAGIIGLAVQVN